MRDTVRSVEAGLTGAESSLRLHVPPEATFARKVRLRVSEFAAQHGVTGEDLIDFLTALGEAVANAVEHARSRETIEVACWMMTDAQIIATVVDSGVGFDAGVVAKAGDALPDALALRGRGFALMRSCCDLFSVRSSPGSGTAVILGRNLRSRA